MTASSEGRTVLSSLNGNSTTMPSLAELFFDHAHYLSDKWEQYIGIYDAELSYLVARGEPIRLLEIGVSNGGSLEIWRKFLPAGSEIVGIDIDPACAKLLLSEGQEVLIGDGASRAELDRMLGDRTFDVIIDDGSHLSSHIISTFEALFPRLRGDGKYFAEDLHASYSGEFEGGFRTPGCAMDYFKGLVDGLNADHFEPSADLTEAERHRLSSFGRTVSRMTFYDSVVVIARLPVPRSQPYRRLFAGSEMPVRDPGPKLAYTPIEEARTILANGGAARQIDAAILAEVEKMKRSLSWRITAPLRALKLRLSK